MARALSQDLRDRVVSSIEGELSCRRAAARFGVGVATAIRWRQLALCHGRASAAVCTVIEQAGASLRFLPPYSPDFNPIDRVYGSSKLLSAPL